MSFIHDRVSGARGADWKCLPPVVVALALLCCCNGGELYGPVQKKIYGTAQCQAQPKSLRPGDSFLLTCSGLPQQVSVRLEINDATGAREQTATTDEQGLLEMPGETSRPGSGSVAVYAATNGEVFDQGDLLAYCTFEVLAANQAMDAGVPTDITVVGPDAGVQATDADNVRDLGAGDADCDDSSCHITPGEICDQIGAECGLLYDPDSGETLNCGTCPAPQTCGAGGTPNTCG